MIFLLASSQNSGMVLVAPAPGRFLSLGSSGRFEVVGRSSGLVVVSVVGGGWALMGNTPFPRA